MNNNFATKVIEFNEEIAEIAYRKARQHYAIGNFEGAKFYQRRAAQIFSVVDRYRKELVS